MDEQYLLRLRKRLGIHDSNQTEYVNMSREDIIKFHTQAGGAHRTTSTGRIMKIVDVRLFLHPRFR